MGRQLGGHNRTTEAILKAKVLKLEDKFKKLEENNRRNWRIMFHKLRDRQKWSLVHAGEIGKIIKHLKGRDLWSVK